MGGLFSHPLTIVATARSFLLVLRRARIVPVRCRSNSRRLSPTGGFNFQAELDLDSAAQCIENF